MTQIPIHAPKLKINQSRHQVVEAYKVVRLRALHIVWKIGSKATGCQHYVPTALYFTEIFSATFTVRG
jgi:hypothetical protein